MQFRGGMNELMRQAARMQRKIEQAKAELREKEIESTSTGGKVKAVVTYGLRVRSIEVDPDFLKTEEASLVLDAVSAAVNQGLELAEKAMESELEKLTGGVKIPGLT